MRYAHTQRGQALLVALGIGAAGVGVAILAASSGRAHPGAARHSSAAAALGIVVLTAPAFSTPSASCALSAIA